MQNSTDLRSSPARKRQRFSSPFEEYFEEPSQEDLAALDRLEENLLLQGSKNAENLGDKENFALISTTREYSKSPVPDHFRSSQTISDSDNPDNPFITQMPSFTSANLTKHSGFTSALHISAPGSSPDDKRSSSPDHPPEHDYASWFAPAPIATVTQFQSAEFSVASSLSSPKPEPVATGFMKASNKGWAIPSRTALLQAEEKMKKIWTEGEADDLSSFATGVPAVTHINKDPDSSSCVSENQTPVRFGRPSITDDNSLTTIPANSERFKRNTKPFKSPLMTAFHSPGPKSSLYASSPLAPKPQSAKSFVSHLAMPGGFPSLSFKTHDSTSVTPLRPQAKRRIMSDTPTKSKFVTPFKTGMRPGEPGHERLVDLNKKNVAPMTMPAIDGPKPSNPEKIKADSQEPRRRRVFDLTKPSNRATLASCGQVPQTYNSADLEAIGINTLEISHVTPALALYYSFYAPSANPFQTTLGPAEALEELRSRGCSLATKRWVDNHWSLILWKLAGMVYLDPHAELNPERTRWCWSEVVRQLLYRYEREINGGIRPALRMVTTRDLPASLPMVLCVSNILWPEARPPVPRIPPDSHPELELTDGWYTLRAEVDQPLSRAIRRHVIRMGCKIAITSARLSSDRKEPSEILDAYNSTKLMLSGNSSHLAPWHAKLGFQNIPFTATLNSLTPDGGVIAALNIVVLKIFPLGFIEFTETEHGKKIGEGPRNEKEEALEHERWKRDREAEEFKLRQAWNKRIRLFERYVDHLERRAAVQTSVENDSPSGDVETLFSELEDNPEDGGILAGVKARDAGLLAQLIQERIIHNPDRTGQEIEQELRNLCPPREVRSFRVIAVKDACTQRRPAHRTAQLTVWDVLNLRTTEEGGAGDFQVGQRFRVTNLIPTQQNAWMGREPGSEVYLCTRRDSRWTRVE